MIEHDVSLADGRNLHVYDSADETGPGELVVVWQGGTPQNGIPPTPLLPLAAELGIRFVAHDRPGYGGSTAQPGRTVADAAGDVAASLEVAGATRFAGLGMSGGGPHTLACAALLPERVTGIACLASIAPWDPDEPTWFDGMAEANEAELRATLRGRDELAQFLAQLADDPSAFPPCDQDALRGPFGPWFGATVNGGMAGGFDGYIDDDLAFVADWGFQLADVVAPSLFWSGMLDTFVPTVHSAWLAAACPASELRTSADDGHISMIRHAAEALTWLRERAA